MRVRLEDGTRLYFDVAGMGLVPQGPAMRERSTLLCLHGGPGFDHSLLKSALAPLQNAAQVVFLDHRGQGRSDENTSDRWNLDTWIQDVVDFCPALDLERPVILGRYFRDPNDERLQEFMSICLPLYNPTPLKADALARVVIRPEVGFHFFRGEGFTYDWFDELDRIRCPTLVLAGELDPVTTVADHEELAAAIPGSRLEVLPNAGHGVFRDRPAEALSIIREFVA